MANPRVGRRADLPLVRASPGAGPIVILLGLIAFPVGFAISADRSSYDTWGAFVWGPLLLALVLPLCRWVARRTGEPQIAGFLFAAAALKIVVGSTARYFMVDSLYGTGDSVAYDTAGGLLAEPFRKGVFSDLGEVTGTRVIEIVTGLTQAIIGETRVGTFLVFSTLGFIGMCLLYVAFCDALPHAERRLYRGLLFLTPTMWFWPSSIGKEAFLMLCIGLSAWGYARMLDGHLRGAFLSALGLWGMVAVRPHLALMIFIGAIAALPPALERRRLPGSAVPRPIGRVFLPLAVLAALPLLLGSVERFFEIEDLNLDSASEVRDEVQRRTSRGDAEFSAPDPNDPLGLLLGVVTVIARPFPWEAHGVQLVASLESVALAAIVLVTIARRRALLILALRRRWPRFALAYVLAFAWAFSAVANFGILARQRSLMLPFLFVLVAAARVASPSVWEPERSRSPSGSLQLGGT